MKIQSKLKELQCDLFSIDTSEVSEGTCIEEKIALDEPNCSAVSQIIYSTDFCLLKTVFDTKIGITDNFSITGEYIQLSYLTDGNPRILLNDTDSQLLKIGNLQLCFSKNTSAEIHMNEAMKFEYICIFFTKEFFIHLFRNASWYCGDSFFKKVARGEYSDLGKLQFPLNHTLHQLTQDLFKLTIEKHLKFHLLQLKFKEIFIHISNLSADNNLPKNLDISEDQYQKIKKVHAYVTLHFHRTPTLKELARMAILNELQLKTGFKKIYGITIRAYIIQLKMERSKSLLARYSVNETASILGYKSVSHFIQSFKKFYGTTPKQIIT
ncbi:AraC-type DNA-binding protein [Pustulibacterium marinum]|uniref:AraC-type DNA-binding protein n=1 Tax=Pustulibacterium marinum TaxID=1224947 RepID=A0A1I7HI87_9FLAO|nr:AraC family transcriptional regulator [Pustulibacterium marinum]SFU60415.1 AraC-type DNA-binding protein [Pustulibacterium marinum]